MIYDYFYFFDYCNRQLTLVISCRYRVVHVGFFWQLVTSVGTLPPPSGLEWETRLQCNMLLTIACWHASLGTRQMIHGVGWHRCVLAFYRRLLLVRAACSSCCLVLLQLKGRCLLVMEFWDWLKTPSIGKMEERDLRIIISETQLHCKLGELSKESKTCKTYRLKGSILIHKDLFYLFYKVWYPHTQQHALFLMNFFVSDRNNNIMIKPCSSF